MRLEKGEIYFCDHTRKGKFTMRITDECSDFVAGVVVEGEAGAMNPENRKQKGDYISVRKRFATFTKFCIQE